MKFGEILDDYLQRNNMIKNEVLRELDIDRSTFYQILNSKRLPTEMVFKKLLSFFNLTAIEYELFLAAYETERVGDRLSRQRSFVRECLRVIGSGDNDRAYVSNESGIGNEKLFEHVFNAKGTQRIDFYMPIPLMRKLGIYELFEKNENSDDIVFRHIIAFSRKFNIEEFSSANDFCDYLNLLLNNNMRLEVYYSDEDNSHEYVNGLIFPYYVITDSCCLMISQDGSDVFLSEDLELTKKYRDNFDKLIEKMSILIVMLSEKESLVKTIEENEKCRLFNINYFPGVSYMANDELISKYFPEEEVPFIKWHSSIFQKHLVKEFNTMAGIEYFKKTGLIREPSFMLQGKKEDVDTVISNLQRRIHNNLEIINTDFIPVSDNWSVSVISDKSIMLVPYLTNENIICIQEPTIVESFTDFFENIGDFGLLVENPDI